MKVFELHPLCSFFPRLGDEEFAALKTDIAENGQTHPIYVMDGMILDGGNRYRALVELGVEPKIIEYAGNNPVQFVLSSNLRRRHLTPGQSAAIVSAAQDWAKAHVAGSNQHQARSSGPATLPDQMATVADRAGLSGVGERTQRMADKLIREAPPELVKDVREGKKSLPQALKEISPVKADMPPPENLSSDDSPISEERADPTLEGSHWDEELDTQAKVMAELHFLMMQDDKLAAAVETIRELRAEIGRKEALIKSLESRVNGMLAENAEAKRHANSRQRRIDKLEKDIQKYKDTFGEIF